jgi:hypothetical protein
MTRARAGVRQGIVRAASRNAQVVKIIRETVDFQAQRYGWPLGLENDSEDFPDEAWPASRSPGVCAAVLSPVPLLVWQTIMEIVSRELIVGLIGAGKSVLLALMAVQFRRHAGAQVFAFDFGGSIRAAALAMGGDWQDLGGALADDVAEPVALRPLARIDDAGERAWASEWVTTLLARESVTITPDLKEHRWSAYGQP